MAFMKFYVGNEANASSHRDGIYIAVDTKKIFYNGSAYGGSEVDLSNYYTIAQVNGKIGQVNGKIGTNVYTGANYISKETNLTEAVLQLDGEIKATNDNLALEHTNAEATYAKKTDLNNYLPLTGGLMKGDIVGNEGRHLHVKALSGNWSNNVNNYITGIGFYDPTGSILIGEFSYYNNAQSSSPEDNSWIGISANVRNVHNVQGDSWRDAPGDCLFRITAKNGVYYDTHKLVDETQLTSYLTKTDARNTYQPKGSYLTSVSIATISDLNSGWDALLKAAPNIPSLNGYATQSWVTSQGFITNIPSEYVTDTELNAKGFLTKATADSTYQAKGNYLTSVSWSQISGRPTFATVATSGSYNDLTNKPSIPSLNGYATQEWVNGRGFLTKTTADGYYQPKGNYLTSVSWSQISGKPTILALGTTSSTAFRGDYGNTAYQHATAKGAAFSSGLYKITTNAQGHVTAATKVVKADITALGIPGSDSNPVFQVYHGETKETLRASTTPSSLIGVPSIVSSTRTDTIREQRLSFPDFGLKKDSTGVYLSLTAAAVASRLPTAGSDAGVICLGYPQSGKNYPVELDDNDRAYVHVPWTDTNTTYSAISTSEIDAVFDAVFN